MTERIERIRSYYGLQPHPEGGWFAEVYKAPFLHNGRALAGSIYFLLEKYEISHFHQIDCDEIWYFHEGCGLKITVLMQGEKKEIRLGPDPELGQSFMAVIPAGAVFAAENLDPMGYTFLSCATAPAFTYEGFHLTDRRELTERFPEFAGEAGRLAIPSEEGSIE